VLSSEGYNDKNGAVAGIASIRINAIDASNFKLKTSTNGMFYFVLEAGNNMVIGTSELYTTNSSAVEGITSVQTASGDAETIADLTTSSATAQLGQFQVFLDGGGKFRFRLIAGNGEPILASQSYTEKNSALNGIDSVRNNVAALDNFDFKTATNGQFYFNLKAQNSLVIGTSETYTTTAARAIGQFAVISVAPDAPLVDLTLGDVPSTRKGRFELFESLTSGNFRFTLKAKNYEVILTSQSYTTKQSAMNGITSVRTNSVIMARYANLNSSDGQYYFTLRAGNNQVIGTSETYESTEGRDNGIASVTSNAPDADLIDNTIDNRYVAKFEIFRDLPTGTKYYFRLRAVNGQQLIVSSSYASDNATIAAINACKVAATLDAGYMLSASDNSFTLLDSTTHTALAYSDVYSSSAARDAGVSSVKTYAPTAIVVEIPWEAPTTVAGQTTVLTTTTLTSAGQTTPPDTPPLTTTAMPTDISVGSTFAPDTPTQTVAPTVTGIVNPPTPTMAGTEPAFGPEPETTMGVTMAVSVGNVKGSASRTAGVWSCMLIAAAAAVVIAL